jgi:LPS export ABC transporter protein LptC
MPPLALHRSPIRFAAIALFAAIVLAGCGSTPRGTQEPAAVELPDQEVSDFALTETDQGKPEWKLYARSAATYRARNRVIAHTVRLDFFDEKGARSSVLTAREGEINEITRDMTARGDVVLQTTEGTRMSTQQLEFVNKTQRIVTDAFVRVERGGDVLTGYGFESDPNLKHYEFKRQVQATVREGASGLLESGKKGGK